MSFTPITLNSAARYRGLRIGLLGGSFNPPHEGHLHLALAARRELALHEVWWVPAFGHPFKPNITADSGDARIAAIYRMIGRRKGQSIAPIEAEFGLHTTHELLSALVARHAPTRFVWLMGSDNLRHLHRWRHWEKIIDLMPIVVLARDPEPLRALSSPAAQRLASRRVHGQGRHLLSLHPWRWTMLTAPRHPGSSTRIRAEQAERAPGSKLNNRHDQPPLSPAAPPRSPPLTSPSTMPPSTVSVSDDLPPSPPPSPSPPPPSIAPSADVTSASASASAAAAASEPMSADHLTVEQHSPDQPSFTDCADSTVLAGRVRDWLDREKAEDIKLIPLTGIVDFADYMVIATALSPRHGRTLGERLMQAMKPLGGVPRIEGVTTGDWILIDSGDIVIHIFQEEVRRFYNLEKLWTSPPAEHEAPLS